MSTLLLLLLLTATQIQPAGDLSPPMALEPPAWYARLTDQLREAEAGMHEAQAWLNGIEASFNVAKDAGMPSFVLEALNRERKLARHQVADRRLTVEITKRELLVEISCRDQGNGPVIGRLCTHCGKVHANSR